MHCRVLLFAVLVLAVTATRAETMILNSSIVMSNAGFNGDIIDLRYTKLSIESQPSVEISASQIVGDGLTVQGYEMIPDVANKIIQITMRDLYVTDATITMNGYMPASTSIVIANVTANMQSAKTLLALSSLHLLNTSSLTLQGVTAMWATATSDAWVARLTSASGGASIQRNSGLFILQVSAQNAAGLLKIATPPGLSLTDNAALTLDYASCKSCSDAIISIEQSATFDNASICRISNIASDVQPVLKTAADVSITNKSLFTVSYANVTNGNLFAISSRPFAVTGGSVLTYSDLNGKATGLSAPVPTSIDASSKAYGRSCVINGASLTTTAAYTAVNLNINALLTPQGYNDGTQTCAYAQCVPSHFSTPATQRAQCACTCVGTFAAPSCATSSDPLTAFLNLFDGKVVCTVPNCAQCSKQPSVCEACDAGYNLQSDSACTKQPPATSATTRFPTPPPGPQPLPPYYCSPNCVQCETMCFGCTAAVCRQCASGYFLHGRVECWKQYNSAHMTTTLPATIGMLLLGAAMGYAA